LASDTESLGKSLDAELLAFGVDQADFSRPDTLVDPVLVEFGCCCYAVDLLANALWRGRLNRQKRRKLFELVFRVTRSACKLRLGGARRAGRNAGEHYQVLRTPKRAAGPEEVSQTAHAERATSRSLPSRGSYSAHTTYRL